jgi:bacillopeptidase F
MAIAGVFLATTIIIPFGKFNIVSAKEGNEKASVSYKETAKEIIAKKINVKLTEEFKNKKDVTFLVKLKDQVDTVKVAKDSVAKASQQKLTSAKTDLLKRSTIVSELRIKSDDTQGNLKNYLQNEKNKGNVKDYTSYYIVNGMSITATENVMKEIAAMPEVESLKPNGTVKLVESKKTIASNVPASGTIEWGLEKIGAPAVWNMGIDGTGTVVASLDTGVQWDHPALNTKYRGYDPANPTTPNNEFNWFDATAGHKLIPYDDGDHGTHTMGTMAGSEANGTNKIGVAPGAKWIAAKIFDAAGNATDAGIIAAGEWMLAPKALDGTPHPEKAPNVINNSWGGDPIVDDWFRQIVKNWKAAGIFAEFSAGNTTETNLGGPGSVANPANYPESFATGATDLNNMLADFSLRGPSQYGGILKPEISAPGVNIRSSIPGNSYEGGWNGTSMAGPHTCGLVALLLQANSSLTVAQLEEIIKNTATPRTDAEYSATPNNGYGYGVINAFDAVSSIMGGLGEVKGQVFKEGKDSVPPTYTHTPVTEGFAGASITLTADVQDDISVSKVELQYKSNIGDQWASVATEIKEGNFNSGKYEGTIPADKVIAPSLSYRWKITDFGNNQTISDYYTINVKSGITVGYSTDFETVPADWKTSGTSAWQLGKPTSGPKAAVSGEKVYATNLADKYLVDSDMTLTMPVIAVPQTGNCYLQFKHWYETEKNYDKGYVNVSTDGKTWTTLKTYTGASSGYLSEQIDLAPYAGKTITIAFNFKCDDLLCKQGWYIDDVKLSDVSIVKTSRNRMMLDGLKSLNKINTKTPAKIEVSGLPLAANVTVVETGRSTTTNPANGSYSIKHKSGDYTLKAETYGYYPQEKKVHIVNDGVMDNNNFLLAPIAKGTMTGKITNAQTGNPIKDATLYLIEDAAITPVKTDAQGNYTLIAYEGNYTVQVMASNYFSDRFNITLTGNKTITKDLKLKPFIGYPGEMGYDDGTAEDASAFYKSGNGLAVKMSLPEGKTSAIVTSGLFKFWDAEFPKPGGTSFKVAIFDATGDAGAPGKMIAGPISATAIRDKNQWTKVDVSGAGAVVNGDFYMLYIQDGDNPNCPGIAFDTSSEYAKRTWQYAGGAFKPNDPANGNCMIRATVKYEAQAPVITSPVNNLFANNENVTIQGTASSGLDVHIINNDKEIAVGKPSTDGKFSFKVKLNDGVNLLKAYSSADNGNTESSPVVKVTVDKVKPVLKVTSPTNNTKTNKETITVTGTVVDSYIDYVKVNGKKSTIASDGSWTVRIMLEEGVNTLNVVAADKAANKVTKNLTIDAKFAIQEITNLKPNKDVNLKAGQSVKIEFDSESGLKKAVFMINAPLVNTNSATANSMGITKGDSVVEFPMTEVEDEDGNGTGHYVGYWTATSNLVAAGAQIEVKASDWYGNTLIKRATGKLNINVK